MSFTRGYALLIGVGTYQYAPRLDVPITAADAQAVAAVLRDPQFCGYPAAQVALLHDHAATRVGILAALDDLAARTTEHDTVLLFYSGHGVFGDDNTYFLTTYDTRLSDGAIAVDGAVSQVELLTKVRALKAQRCLLIFNACHAGAISPTLAGEGEMPAGQNPPLATTAALLSTGEGRVIITANRQHQYAFIGTGELTIFTQALVDGLRGNGVSSQRGYISVFDLYTHLYFSVGEAVQQQVPETSRKRYGETQEPELTVLKGVGPFAVALYRGAPTLGDFAAPARPAEGTAVREVEPDYSRALLQQILRAGGDIVGRDKVGGDQAGGDVIKVGDISGSKGIAIGRGAQAIVSERAPDDTIAALFAPIYTRIDARTQEPEPIRKILTDTVASIEREVATRERADAGQLAGWLAVLARIAPDILELTADALTDPAAEVAAIVRQVAGQARQAVRG